MRYDASCLELRASLVGSIAQGKTAVGAPIDTRGFRDVLAVLMVGMVTGTAANYGSVTVKFQESTSPTGTGAGWTDVTPGTINSTFAFSALGGFVGTDANLQQRLMYERLDDSNRKRYIRAHATCAGTDSCNIKYAVGLLMGNPYDTLYVTQATSIATGNVEFALGK
jgi:hypothetical protein